MKIQLVSDLHLEFAPIEITNTDNADILVLSGDILIADRFTRSEASPYFLQAQEWRSWFERTCAQYKQVYYVLGNHEHYYGRFDLTGKVLQDNLGHISNLYILNNDVIDSDNFIIVGTTLWTDFDRNPVKASAVQQGLNDYKLIQRSDYTKLRPADTASYNSTAKTIVSSACSSAAILGKRVLVFGHHAPSYKSVADQYRGDELNPGYASHLDEFILDHPQIHLWTHGHTHTSHRYKIGNTLVACNPRGYANKTTNENPNFTTEYYINI